MKFAINPEPCSNGKPSADLFLGKINLNEVKEILKANSIGFKEAGNLGVLKADFEGKGLLINRTGKVVIKAETEGELFITAKKIYGLVKPG